MSEPACDVVGVGLAMVDVLVRLPDLPAWGGDLATEELDVQGGGSTANVLCALARLGLSTRLLGSLGDDLWGRLALEELEREGVDASAVRARPGSSSPLSIVLIQAATGQRRILYRHGDAAPLAAGEIDRETICRARALHLNGRHPEAALLAARWAREAGVLVSLNGGPGGLAPDLRAFLPLADLVVAPADFVLYHSGESDLQAAGPGLLRLGPRIVVATLGERGSWCWSATGETFHEPALAVTAVDTTGAGDAYHGTFLAGLLAGEPLARCARLASAAGARICSALGSRRALPRLAEVAVP